MPNVFFDMLELNFFEKKILEKGLVKPTEERNIALSEQLPLSSQRLIETLRCVYRWNF